MKSEMRRTVSALALAVVVGSLTFGSLAAAAQTPEKSGKAQVSAEAKPTKAPARKTKALPAEKVNLNTASAAQLSALPRIGPKVAQRIVEYRTAHKAFRSVDELRNVKGVGPKVLDGIRPYVTL